MRPTEPEIPDKKYFRIGEVSAIAGVESYVLRYWESEFSGIKPHRSGAGQRLYRKQDIELVLKIKDLLYNQRFTIAGARRHLRSPQEPIEPDSQPLTLETLREELAQIKELLDE